MKQDYKDITSRIAEAPVWYDENGVPRYDTFDPSDLPSIYADEAVLFAIACQCCGRKFKVARSEDRYKYVEGVLTYADSLKSLIDEGSIGYGDPPCFGEESCHAGATMSSNNVKVLEYWSRKNEEMEWKIDPSYSSKRLDEDDED